MKEFDFDELDKAVNSLMGSVKKPDDTAVPVAVAPPTEPTTPVSNSVTTETSPVEEPTYEPEPIAPETPSEQPAMPEASPSPVAARRGGRFMDVVHPSSDMKTTPAVAAPSREGITVQPPSAVSAPTPVAPVMDMITPAVKRATPQPTVPVTSVSPAENEAPAPSTPPTEPWSSPFLPDAQVEKRPLGGNQPASETGLSDAIAEELSKVLPPEDATPESSTDTNTKPDNAPEPELKDIPVDADDESTAEPAPDTDPQLAPEPADAPLPAELNSDLVAIESGQKSTTSEEIHRPAPPIDSSVGSTSSFAGAALSTSSISPQYNEQPSTGDSSHQPIYDNEAIHQPLAHPPKKKKGMLVVIMIVAVVLVGSGVGAAAYFLGLL